MNLIVAVDKNWAIGKNNRMMWSIPADMKFFRETTSGNIVIMGRKTLESFRIPDMEGRIIQVRLSARYAGESEAGSQYLVVCEKIADAG